MNEIPDDSIPRFDQLEVDHLKNPIWIYDTVNYGVYWANRAALALWESDCLNELTSRDFEPDTSDAVQETLLAYLDQFRAGEIIDRWWQISPKNIDKKVFCRFSGVEVSSGHLAMLVEAQDSELVKGNESESHSAAMVALFSSAGALISCNPPFSQRFPTQFSSLELQFGTDSESYLKCYLGQGSWDRLLKTNSGNRWHSIDLRWQSHGQKNEQNYIISLIDVHDRKLNELEHAENSYTDPLTRLLNRRGMEERISHSPQALQALFYVDLDNFKPINDAYGHHVGDALLVHVAQVLRDDIARDAVCARLGGDEFVVIIPRSMSTSELRACSENIIRKLSKATTVGENSDVSVSVSASVGIAQFPRDGSNLAELLACADAAMYAAKKGGRSLGIRYVKGMEDHFSRRATIVRSLSESKTGDALNPLYQTILNWPSKSVAMVDVTPCWQITSLGDIHQKELLMAAEEAGYLAVLESWLVTKVSSDITKLQQRYGDSIKICINVSSAYLLSPMIAKDLHSLALKGLLDDFVFVTSESVYVDLLESGHQVLLDFQQQGVALMLSNVGVSSSCLPFLENNRVDYIRLDQRFIEQSPLCQTTLAFIAGWCRQLNVSVIADGIRDKVAAKLLLKSGFTLQQGSYHSQAEYLSPPWLKKADHKSLSKEPLE